MMETPITTHGRVRVPANPYLRCVNCGARIEYWIDGERPARNYPCDHAADYKDDCPSWGPVDGCQCQAHLGYRPHPDAPDPVTEHGKTQGPL